jgi:hypothetical protein
MTAVEFLVNKIKTKGFFMDQDVVAAKEMEKQQHGRTWDEAINAHDNRGHVHARSLVDFDEYYNETFNKTQAQ